MLLLKTGFILFSAWVPTNIIFISLGESLAFQGTELICLSSQLFLGPCHQTALHFGALPSAARPRKSFHKHVSIPASHLSQEIVPVCRNSGNHPQLQSACYLWWDGILCSYLPCFASLWSTCCSGAAQAGAGWRALLSSVSLSPLTSIQAFSKYRSLVDYDFNEEYSYIPISEWVCI